MSIQNQLQGKWKSTEQIERLPDYGLDFSKWIGQGARDGHYYFSVLQQEEEIIAQVDIPVGVTGYFSIYKGRFQSTKTQIKIWQNDQNPVRIKYTLGDDLLTLKLFSTTIRFKKTNSKK
ncbi:hypothetical protein WAF17_11625 [Bernardetia sp. ABR2-2B]|uniref:hypothetical protein n=1 Tax=Bernardetia sp. ABR2-2B TaxID=3127472 RepID=UPI0030CD1ADC